MTRRQKGFALRSRFLPPHILYSSLPNPRAILYLHTLSGCLVVWVTHSACGTLLQSFPFPPSHTHITKCNVIYVTCMQPYRHIHTQTHISYTQQWIHPLHLHTHTLMHTHTELFFDTSELSQMVPLKAGGQPSKHSVPLSYYCLPKVHADRAFSPENT